MDQHGQDILIKGLEQNGFTLETSTGLDFGLTYEIGINEDVGLTIASQEDVVHWVSLWWSIDCPVDVLLFLSVHVDPFDSTFCVTQAQPEELPLILRGNNIYAEMGEALDGYELTFTSWEFMPAFQPDKLPSTCEKERKVLQNHQINLPCDCGKDIVKSFRELNNNPIFPCPSCGATINVNLKGYADIVALDQLALNVQRQASELGIDISIDIC